MVTGFLEPIVAAVVAGVIGALGWLLRRLILKWRHFWKRFSKIEEDAKVSAERTDALFHILFGDEDNPFDEGMVVKVDEGFEEVEQEIDTLDGDIDDLENATAIVLITLDKHGDIDFDKEDFNFKAELRQYRD